MSGALEATVAHEEHPLRTAMLARDADALIDTFAEDIVLWSPIATDPFVGKTEVAELMRELVDLMDELEYPEEWNCGSTEIVTFRGRIGGWPVEGVELLRHDDEGKVREIRVHTRPITGSAAFAKALGPALAKRRGKRRNHLIVLLTAYFGPRVLATGEKIAFPFYRRPRD